MRFRLIAALLATAAASTNAGAVQQQRVEFDATVDNPAFVADHPRVLFDEAHFNLHTVTGETKPLVDLLTNDGYRVTANQEKFQRRILDDYDILIIVNAYGVPPDRARGKNNLWRQWSAESTVSAFTATEADAVRDWVSAGGSLLLIADHAPWGAAAKRLASRFGVDMRNVETRDPSREDPLVPISTEGRFILFSQGSGLSMDHPILLGRDETERVDTVVTFHGHSLAGPASSTAILALSDEALDWSRASPDAEWETRSAAGRAQGIALRFGEGRVVVLGEAAMFIVRVLPAGDTEFPMGLLRDDTDNRQLALNIMHWLSGLLE